VLGTLLTGACGCIFDPITRGLAATGEWIADAGVTVHMTAPSAVAATAAALEAQGRQAPSVRLVTLGGERSDREHVEAAQRVFPEAVVRSLYGTTEAGFIATASVDPGERPKDGLTAFEPFPWQSVEVFSESGDPLPPGEIGEIVVRGNDIALGYWIEPEEGEQRFLPETGGVRSVRTGDRGRLLPDGRFEHLGRLDLRVKVHGQMVDLQAVEHALAELPAVREAVVSAVAGPRGTRLVAHILPATSGTLSPAELRAGLADKLPSFMIPSAFLPVETFSKNLWGKIDREGLRQTAATATSETDYSPPRDAREQALAELVAEALDLERVGREDDLFELGLDSFAMTELLVAVDERLGVEWTPRDLLRAPTVAALAPRIDAPSTDDDVISPLQLEGSGTPFFCAPGADYVLHRLLPLARCLGRPMYSFVARGFERRALPDRSVERAAARYVRGMRRVQPSGPYLIGGYLALGGCPQRSGGP
jgi:acyl carrier protein